jgi:hypothetical protein
MRIDGRYLFLQPHLDGFDKEQAEKQAAGIRQAREATGTLEGHEQPAAPVPRRERSVAPNASAYFLSTNRSALQLAPIPQASSKPSLTCPAWEPVRSN